LGDVEVPGRYCWERKFVVDKRMLRVKCGVEIVMTNRCGGQIEAEMRLVAVRQAQ
jgi:hypothetical protein